MDTNSCHDALHRLCAVTPAWLGYPWQVTQVTEFAILIGKAGFTNCQSHKNVARTKREKLLKQELDLSRQWAWGLHVFLLCPWDVVLLPTGVRRRLF